MNKTIKNLGLTLWFFIYFHWQSVGILDFEGGFQIQLHFKVGFCSMRRAERKGPFLVSFKGGLFEVWFGVGFEGGFEGGFK
jgi:hypothetical protein